MIALFHHPELFCLQDRVDDAYWNLRRTTRLGVGEPDNGLELGASGSPKIDTEACTSISSEERDLHSVVSFKRQNFVLSHHPVKEHYDTILW